MAGVILGDAKIKEGRDADAVFSIQGDRKGRVAIEVIGRSLACFFYRQRGAK
jgi:hypothetical protein